MHADKANAAIFVSSGTCTSDAAEFAQDRPIRLIDGEELADMVAALQEERRIEGQTYNIIKTDRANPLFLTALLNSRLVKFWLKHRGKMQGQNFQVDKEPLLAIPLFVPKKAEQERWAKVVQRIIECKKKIASAETDAVRVQLQRILDQSDEQLHGAIESMYELDDSERLLLVASINKR